MFYKKNSDGTIFDSLEKVVDTFRCPGPCNPDCVLYSIKPLPGSDGEYGHMCCPDWYHANLREICETLDLTPIPTKFSVGEKYRGLVGGEIYTVQKILETGRYKVSTGGEDYRYYPEIVFLVGDGPKTCRVNLSTAEHLLLEKISPDSNI